MRYYHMMLKLLLAGSLAFAPVTLRAQDTAQPTPVPQASPTPAPTAEPIKGETRETAYKVKSIGEEYAIMRKLGLKPSQQALVFEKDHPYDVLTGTDSDGKTHDVWFDIKSFFGKGFGF